MTVEAIFESETIDVYFGDIIYIGGEGGDGGAVDSVNEQMGDVILDADDIDDTSTDHKFATSAELAAISANTSHGSDTSNPHEVTKTQVGLSNVDNTSDVNKPISTATQAALDSITAILASDETDLDTLQEIVDFIELNREDLDALTIASIAGLQTALDLKANEADLGTAAAAATGDFATSAQGTLADSATQPGDLATVATTGDYDDLSNKPTLGTAAAAATGDFVSSTAPFWDQVVLTANKVDIAAGTGVAVYTHTVAGTITGFKLVCSPSDEPSASSVEVDLNSIDLSTGAATSRLTSVAEIATSANISTGGVISGTQTVAFGDRSSFDIDQGSDGQELLALIQITPS